MNATIQPLIEKAVAILDKNTECDDLLVEIENNESFDIHTKLVAKTTVASIKYLNDIGYEIKRK